MAETWVWVSEQFQRPLVLFGFAAQFAFFLRFVVQWLASERRGEVHVPVAFWYLSIVGGAMTLVYATVREDLVFMVSQALGLAIYVRNLVLIHRSRVRRGTAPQGASSPDGAAGAERV